MILGRLNGQGVESEDYRGWCHSEEGERGNPMNPCSDLGSPGSDDWGGGIQVVLGIKMGWAE